jgi:hypothetical protein
MSAQPRWDYAESARRPVETATSEESDRTAARVVSVIALASIATGAIHIAAAATLGSGNGQTFAFFAIAAAAEIVWGLVALVAAPRWWLALGALGNALIVATWVVSRTVALPFGPYAHIVLPVGFPDALATILGTVTAIGAAWLAIRGLSPARSAMRAGGFVLAAVVLFGALGIAGAMSQANASSGGSSGGSGQTAPYAPNGNGSYGGGSTGGSTGGGGSTTGGGGHGGY